MGGMLQKLALRLDARFNAKHVSQFRDGWASRSRGDVRFYDTDRVMFRYREAAGPEGAPTIVFTADPPVTLEQYDDLIELASRDFRVVIIELPGNGFSPGKRHYRFGFEETNDEVAAFLRDVAGEQAIYAFSCAAGLAAVDIAARYPELVRALVLIQTASVAGFSAWKSARDPKGILARPILGQYAMRKMARARMPQWFNLAVGRKVDRERFCSCSDTSLEHGALWSLASAYQVYLSPDIKLGTPLQPTLAVWGQADGSHTKETMATTAKMAANVEVRTFQELGHFPELEEPELVYPVVRDWLMCMLAS
uniref:alpha/beta fold hydrolase n=1 Tax=uncultured Altererythrobacter sp. TaxID=500840 RepID=UPI00261B8480|nr:alpha/beta hydrolase [uncultured Altererythrobacter sp.]